MAGDHIIGDGDRHASVQLRHSVTIAELLFPTPMRQRGGFEFGWFRHLVAGCAGVVYTL